jgi:transcriptional regulator with XRE-family HTH domain
MRRSKLHPSRSQVEAFLRILRDTRVATGLTQVDLSRELGTTQGMVSKCESGGRRLQVIELWNWLRAMNVSFSDFMAALDTELEAQAAADEAFVVKRRPETR